MTKSQHTPGPWLVGELAPGKPYVFVEEEREIARLYDKRGSFPQASIAGNDYLYGGQAEANARLIASAPDLLASLKYVLPLVEDMEKRIKRATTETPWGVVAANAIRAAILKAEGQS